MRKEDAELIEEFMELSPSPDGWVLEVEVVKWESPSTPISERHQFKHWPALPTEQELAAAQKKALASRRFFRICQRCGERNNIGHMHDEKICQGCAEKDFGVVY